MCFNSVFTDVKDFAVLEAMKEGTAGSQSDRRTLVNAPPEPDLCLPFDLKFDDLYHRDGVVRLDSAFLQHLGENFPDLRARLESARQAPDLIATRDESSLIIQLAPILDRFIGRLFGILPLLESMDDEHARHRKLQHVKRRFVQKKISTFPKDRIALLNGGAVTAQFAQAAGLAPTELNYVDTVAQWMQSEADHVEPLKVAADYAAWAALTADGKRHHADWILFKFPHKLDAQNLVPVTQVSIHGVPQLLLDESKHRNREGFELTDHGTDLAGAMDQIAYCIKCHHQLKDSCSKGFWEKTGAPRLSPFKIPLAGCPLEEKISEMHEVKEGGFSIGSLAVIVIDNPMAAGTGHRICNDCMKSCIYQKQEPVDIPQAESRTLKDVLHLPWGFEIYSLLTRWNPLNFRRPYPREDTGRKILVVGLGPAGFTLAHHLMNDGHTVVAVDGLKIEPLPTKLCGVDADGSRKLFAPVHDIADIRESLDERMPSGFGGVAEYGITVRWDKNNLKFIRLLLERREQFRMFGGVRFGGTITSESAFAMGFDHIALCAGAGRPTVIGMKNGLAKGVRQASDFLMALQLTGAAKADSIANLQLRLPVVVIGGGLTAIDTATEALAYYPGQVEKFLSRYEKLVHESNVETVRAQWTAEDRHIATEFLEHAQMIRDERTAAAKLGRAARIPDLINSWGGVTVAYRRGLQEAPSYTLNHEEVAKAMEEGIRFAEGLTPHEVAVDEFGAVAALVVTREKPTGEAMLVSLPAKAILVAAGTQPNTVLAREEPESVMLDGKYFQAVDEGGEPVKPERTAKPKTPHVLMSLRSDGRAMSFFGDLHPSFSGNVVKAMGSAKQGFPVVSRVLAKSPVAGIKPSQLLQKLNDELQAVVHEVIRLTPNIVEVVVRAPLAARAFLPGQFYRLQNYESNAALVDGTRLAMEGLALTGASVDPDKGLLSTIVLEMGGSSDLCALLKPGERVVLMGPTGSATETPAGETVILIGGGLGNAVLFSIGEKLRRAGSRVLYFAGYKRLIDRYKIDDIERAADVVVWCCDEPPGFQPRRADDKTYVGNIISAMLAYANGSLGETKIPFNQAHRLIAIGSDGMMNAVKNARRDVLHPYLNEEHIAIGSINSPMQCMMKEICAQCLQVHRNPETGKEETVFSCFNQDQKLDHVQFDNLRDRLTQNSTVEKVTKLWVDHCLRAGGYRK